MLRNLFVIGVMVVLLGGCAIGKNFDRMQTANMQLGKTTKEEVLARFGPPLKEQTQTFSIDAVGNKLESPQILEKYSYEFADRYSNDPLLPAVWPARHLNVLFRDNILIAYFGGSSFKSDSTDFDFSKVSILKKGETTEKEVLSAFGPPSGRGIYPFAASPDGRNINYAVNLRNYPPGSITNKWVAVYFNKDGILENFKVESKADPIPYVPSPTPVYIYTPPPKSKH